VTPLERRCRFLLRAWPWRDRWERGEELVGTMLDVSDENRTWPSPTMAADMVVAGIRARRRRRPPWTVRVQLTTRARIDHRWHEWMLDRLLAPGWRRRMAMANARYVLTYMLVMRALFGPFERPRPIIAALTVGMLALILVVGFLIAGWDRARILNHNGYALEGSPPRLVSRLVWMEQGERIANVRLAPVVAAVSLPLFLVGRALAVFLLSPTGRLDFRFSQPLVISLTIGLFALSSWWTVVHRIPAGDPGRPTRWPGRWSLPAAAIAVVIEVIVLLVAPMGALGLAGGVLGLMPAAATFVLLREERRIGRTVGLWDVVPRLAPRTVARIGPLPLPSWPDRSQSGHAHPQRRSP
jgi:hypothetical protein